MNSSTQKNADRVQRQLQQEAIAQQAEHQAYLINQAHLSQERLIEKQAREQERLMLIALRSENPTLYYQLQTEEEQRRQLYHQIQEQAEAAADFKVKVELARWKENRQRHNRIVLVILPALLTILAIAIYVFSPERPSGAAPASSASNAPLLKSESPPSPPIAAAAAPDDFVYQLTRDAIVVTEPEGTEILRTVHENRFVHVIGRDGGWLHIRMHDGTEGYIPQDAAVYVSEWNGSTLSDHSP